MNGNLITKNGKNYLAYKSSNELLRTEQDASDIIGECLSTDTNRIILYAEALSEDFFKLRTGLAGAVLQKLVNYRIKTAVVITDESIVQGRAKEMLAELNRGRDFRAFAEERDALAWLLEE